MFNESNTVRFARVRNFDKTCSTTRIPLALLAVNAYFVGLHSLVARAVTSVYLVNAQKLHLLMTHHIDVSRSFVRLCV